MSMFGTKMSWAKKNHLGQHCFGFWVLFEIYRHSWNKWVTGQVFFQGTLDYDHVLVWFHGTSCLILDSLIDWTSGSRRILSFCGSGIDSSDCSRTPGTVCHLTLSRAIIFVLLEVDRETAGFLAGGTFIFFDVVVIEVLATSRVIIAEIFECHLKLFQTHRGHSATWIQFFTVFGLLCNPIRYNDSMGNKYTIEESHTHTFLKKKIIEANFLNFLKRTRRRVFSE